MKNVQCGKVSGGARTSSMLRKQGGSADGTYVMLGIHCNVSRKDVEDSGELAA